MIRMWRELQSKLNPKHQHKTRYRVNHNAAQ